MTSFLKKLSIAVAFIAVVSMPLKALGSPISYNEFLTPEEQKKADELSSYARKGTVAGVLDGACPSLCALSGWFAYYTGNYYVASVPLVAVVACKAASTLIKNNVVKNIKESEDLKASGVAVGTHQYNDSYNRSYWTTCAATCLALTANQAIRICTGVDHLLHAYVRGLFWYADWKYGY